MEQMSKLISIDEKTRRTLDKIRIVNHCSYSEAIRILGKEKKSFEEEINEKWEPIQKMCIEEIGSKMRHALELERVIILLLKRKDDPDKIGELIEILTEYLENL